MYQGLELKPMFQNQAQGKTNMDRAMAFSQQAGNSYGSMQKKIPEPGKNVGEAAMTGLGGAAAGASMAAALPFMSNPVGVGIGVTAALASYLMS